MTDTNYTSCLRIMCDYKDGRLPNIEWARTQSCTEPKQFGQTDTEEWAQAEEKGKRRWEKKKLHNKKPHDLYTSPNIISEIKSRDGRDMWQAWERTEMHRQFGCKT